MYWNSATLCHSGRLGESNEKINLCFPAVLNEYEDFQSLNILPIPSSSDYTDAPYQFPWTFFNKASTDIMHWS